MTRLHQLAKRYIRENNLSNSRAKILRQTILYKNNKQINRLKHKLHNLCTYSRSVNPNFVHISNAKLSITEIEGIHIRYHSYHSHQCRRIPIPKKHHYPGDTYQHQKTLPKNKNIIIATSDKGGRIFVTDANKYIEKLE